MSIKAPPLKSGFFYHLHSRGINRENIFIEERNYGYFLELYAKHFAPFADTFAYCLLRNHFHLLVRIHDDNGPYRPEGIHVPDPRGFSTSDPRGFGKPLGSDGRVNPSQAFSNFLNAYAKGINKAYGRTGSLFQSRFGREVVEDDAYFRNLVAYIHRNPEHHHFVEDFRDWPYSSYTTILSEKMTQLNRDGILGWFGDRGEFVYYHAHDLDYQLIAGLVLDDVG